MSKKILFEQEGNDLAGIFTPVNQEHISRTKPTHEKKQSNAYIAWSAFASILMAFSATIRGIESTNPLPAKFMMSLFYVFLASFMIVFYRVRQGKDF